MTGYTQTAQQRPSCPDSLAKEQILYGTCPGFVRLVSVSSKHTGTWAGSPIGPASLANHSC